MLPDVLLSKGKHVLMFNVQLCLTFERVSVMFEIAVIIIVQKSGAYGYG